MNDLPTTPTTSPATLSLSLRSYLQVLRRRRWLILGLTLIAGLLAALPAVLAEPVYESTAKVRISTLDDEGVFDTDANEVTSPNERFIVQLNEIEIIRSKSMRTAVEAQFIDGVPDFEHPEVEQVGFTEIVDISVTADDPATAADVANAYAEVFVEDRRNRSVETLNVKVDELRQQSADASREIDSIGAQLAAPDLAPGQRTRLELRQTTLVAQVIDFDSRADELAVEAALRGRGTEVVEAAELEMDPIRPSIAQGALIGLVIGGLLALAIAVVADTIQDRINSAEELAELRPDVPVLASVPRFDERDEALAFAAREAFRYLRTGLRVRALSAPLRSILVTSAIGGEGKTTSCVHLARALAETSERVVLVDCDLRRPTLHRHFGLSNERGLSSVVVGDDALGDVIHFVDDNLAVVTAGPAVQNPTEVLSSEPFARLLEAITAQADFTLLDTPPTLPVADSLIASQLVDGVLAVCRMGEVRRRQLSEMTARLESADVRLLGYVANGTDVEAPYGYYDPERRAAPAAATADS